MTSNNKTKLMILTALFTALTAVGAFIKIPLPPIPVTMQMFFIVMAGLLLGPKWGTLSQLIYLAIGLMGVPIFTAGGGPGYVFYPTFGYLVTFPLIPLITGLLLKGRRPLRFLPCFAASFVAMVTNLLLGTIYMYGIYHIYLGQPQTIQWALAAGFFPFLIGDTVLVAVVALLSLRILKILEKSGLYVQEF